MISRKKHFKKKIEVTMRKIWDMEFLLDQYKQMREGFRIEYDRIKELIDGVETYEFLIRKLGADKAREFMRNAEASYNKRDELKDAKDIDLSKEDKDILTSVSNDVKGKRDDISRLERQIKDVDLMIEGDPEQPASVTQSVQQNISNLKSVIESLKEIVK
jgi:hypothetical protein